MAKCKGLAVFASGWPDLGCFGWVSERMIDSVKIAPTGGFDGRLETRSGLANGRAQCYVRDDVVDNGHAVPVAARKPAEASPSVRDDTGRREDDGGRVAGRPSTVNSIRRGEDEANDVQGKWSDGASQGPRCALEAWFSGCALTAPRRLPSLPSVIFDPREDSCCAPLSSPISAPSGCSIPKSILRSEDPFAPSAVLLPRSANCSLPSRAQTASAALETGDILVALPPSRPSDSPPEQT